MANKVNLYLWTGTVWKEALCDANGKMIIDPSEILEDTPTDGEVGKAPTSNWAYDHEHNSHDKVETEHLLFSESDEYSFKIRNLADTAYKSLKLATLEWQSALRALLDAATIEARAANENYLRFIAYDTDDATAEVARLVGAATAYFQATRGLVLNPMTDPANIVEGWLFYDSTDDRLAYRNASQTLALPNISVGNKTIYVDKEATGNADGTSWTDAFTTIQAAIDCIEDIIVHAYTIYVRDGTKKTGTADSNVANKLHDTGEFVATTTWAGRRVFNVDDGTWGVVSARDSDDQLSIVDTAGAALDLFPDGDEAYVIEPTPYRETVYLNSLPATNPAKLISGSLTIRAEYYWYGDCDTQANAGEILDATADFTGVEVGDRVFVIDLNGANGRNQDYEVGTVDDISQIGSDIVRTTLTKTPTANWKYTIAKTEISGSDDGLDSGTARSYCFNLRTIDNVELNGFLLTFSDSHCILAESARALDVNGAIVFDCDNGIRYQTGSDGYVYYSYIKVYGYYALTAYPKAGRLQSYYCVFDAPSYYVVSAREMSQIMCQYCYIDNGSRGVLAWGFSYLSFNYGTISGNATIGAYARNNSSISLYLTTNSGVTPEDPAGTTEGAYIS